MCIRSQSDVNKKECWRFPQENDTDVAKTTTSYGFFVMLNEVFFVRFFFQGLRRLIGIQLRWWLKLQVSEPSKCQEIIPGKRRGSNPKNDGLETKNLMANMRLLGVHGVGNLQLNCCWSMGQPWWSITCCQLLPKLATCDRIDGASLSLCHHLRFSQSKVQLFFGPWYCPWAKRVVTWALAYDSWLPKQTVKLWKVITPQRPPRSTVNRTRDGTIDSKIRESGESTITEIDSCSFCFFDHFFLNFCDVVRMDSLHATGSGPERVNGLQQFFANSKIPCLQVPVVGGVTFV